MKKHAKMAKMRPHCKHRKKIKSTKILKNEKGHIFNVIYKSQLISFQTDIIVYCDDVFLFRLRS